MFISCRPSSAPSLRTCLAACVLTITLAGCSGSTGPAGPAGAAGAVGPPGPPGPSGSGSGLDITTAQTITATITSVTIPAPPAAAQPVVKFTLVNEIGLPLKGLTASSLGFVVAKLVPAYTQLAAVPPQTTAPKPEGSSQWQSYIYHTAAPACSQAPCPVTTPPTLPGTPQPQATTERGTGVFVDNGDGTYQYTFSKDISKDLYVTYDATLTHRVGLEIRGFAPANSPVYTFQPSTGATSNIASREIVDDKTCKNCHMTLAFHGGARTEVQYCVMCHNPSSIDPSTGNSLDFKVMFHKIHMGVNLPSVMKGGSYYIYGYMNRISDFSKIVFPTLNTVTGTSDLRTCYKCHNESDPATPQTVDWRNNPVSHACGSCHDNVNFQTGTNHSNISVTSDNECATCHGPNSQISTGSGPPTPPSHLPPNTSLRVDSVHTIPAREFQKKFQYNILKTTNTGQGQTPVIQFSVTDPTNNGKPWDLLNDEPFTNCAAASRSDSIVMIAWNTLDYTNTGTGANGGEIDIPVACAASPPTKNLVGGTWDGTFSITSPMAIPPDVSGTAGFYFNGHPSHDLQDGYGVSAIPVPNVIAYSSITDPSPVTRRDVVDVNKCNVCHDQLNPLAHGGDRVATVKGCPFCHAPNATDQATRWSVLGVATAADAEAKAPDHLQEQSIDLKVMIHAAHYGANRGQVQNAPFVVYHNGAVHDFTTFTPFPGAVNNCLSCHLTDTYYPPDASSSTPLASAIQTVDAKGVALPNQIAVTAGAAVCSSCHATAIAKTHMMQNGANFAAKRGANNQVVSSESCLVCHGSGALADVKVVHKLASYQ